VIAVMPFDLTCVLAEKNTSNNKKIAFIARLRKYLVVVGLLHLQVVPCFSLIRCAITRIFNGHTNTNNKPEQKHCKQNTSLPTIFVFTFAR
jgi:hypothetical protein